jgi:rubrerythrin
VPWEAFDLSRTSAGLRALVREMAFYELATFSATKRFLDAYPDELDLTEWLSIWFYEETRHPLVLMRWLDRCGEKFDDRFVATGRVSTPFMKSKTGTLVLNLLSELTAAAAYLALSEASPEPVLRHIARRVACDEARHATSFFTFTRRRLEAAERPARERLDALKVLHFWLNESTSLTHPVARTMQKAAELQLESGVTIDVDGFRRRACELVGLLVGEELTGPDAVARALAAHTALVHAGA